MFLCRHCEERRDDRVRRGACAKAEASRVVCVALDCFAEPVIGPRFARTRWLAMTDANTVILRCRSEAEASKDERPRCESPAVALRGSLSRAPQGDGSRISPAHRSRLANPLCILRGAAPAGQIDRVMSLGEAQRLLHRLVKILLDQLARHLAA